MIRLYKIFLFFVILLIGFNANSQIQLDTCTYVIGKDTIDFCEMNARANNVPKRLSRKIDKLVNYLTATADNDYEKTLVFYTYISENIKYDLAKAKRVKKKKVTRILSARELIRSKKGICGDVSYLFQDMCERSGVKSRVVLGYTKQKKLSVFKPKRKKVDHAWNVVKIYDTWFQIDATWGMHLYTEKEKNREFVNYSYYLPHPDFFNSEHLPVDPIWQLSPNPITWNYFKWRSLSVKRHNYSTNYNFNDSINKRLSLDKIEEIIASANSALNFIPKNKYVVIQLLNLPAKDFLDKKKQKNKKLTLEEYYSTQKLYKTIIKYLKTIDSRKSRGIANYIGKELKKVEKKIYSLEKRAKKNK